MNGIMEKVMGRPAVTASSAVVAAVAAASAVYYLYRPQLDFPGPGRHSLNKILGAFGPGGDSLPVLQDLEEKYGHVLTLHSLFGNALIISDPKVLADLFRDIDLFLRPKALESMVDVFGPSLFLMNNPQWEPHRKTMIKAVKNKNLRFGFETSIRKTLEMIGMWNQQGDEVTVDILGEADKLLSDIAGLELFNCDFGAITKDDLTGIDSFRTLMDFLSKRFGYPRWLAPIVHPMGSKENDALQWWTSRIEQGVSERMKLLQQGDDESRVADMLDTLLESGFDARHIQGELMGTFMAAKFTTTATFCLIVMALAEHPEVAKRARAEIVMELGDSKEALYRYEDLGKLTYLDCIIKEVLRRYQPATLSMRETSANCTLNGKQVPKGTWIFIDIRGLHMNPEYFPDPEAFKPERWLKAEEWLQPGTFVPFFDGPQRCLGEKFALSTLKAVTATLLMNFDWKETPGQGPLVIRYVDTPQFPNRKYTFKRRA